METTLFYSAAIGFVTLTAIIYFLVLLEFKKALEKTVWDARRKNKIYDRVLYSVAGWTIFISTLSITGFFQDFSIFPPRLMVVLIIPLITILTITFSKTTKELLPFIPAKSIVRLQAFRVFVEILLWLLFIQNIAPVQMPANTIVTRFPFVWLPGLLVPLAYGLHFLSLWKLSLNK